MRRRAHLLLAALLAAVGCNPAAGGGDAGAPFSRDWNRNPALFTLSGVQQIDALGDLHGDFAVTIRMLVKAGLMSATSPYRWTGGTRALVITGDVIDKGSAATAIIDLLIELEAQARAAGGAVVVTLGNHEAEFLAEPMGDKSREFQAELLRLSLDPAKVALGASRYGEWLNNRPVAALIDGWFFSHAGNTDKKSAASIGQKYRELLSVKPAGATVFTDSYLLKSSSLLEESGWWSVGGAGPVALIDEHLAALPAKHLVFGHDPGALPFPTDPQGDRTKGQMAMRYAGRLFAIDVGMSSAIGYSDGALLRIERGVQETASAVHLDGRVTQLWP